MWMWTYLELRSSQMIKLRWNHWGGGLIWLCPYKKRKFIHRHAQWICHMKMKADIRGDVCKSQGTHRLPASHQKLGESQGKGFLSQPSKGTNPADILISDFWPLGLWDNTFLWFKLSSPVVLFSSPSKLILCYIKYSMLWIK